MAIEFSCKSCGTTLRVPDEHAGKQARCPNCQSLNVVLAGSSGPVPGAYPPKQPDPNQAYAAGPGSVYPAGGVAGHAYQAAHRGGMILTLGILAIVCNVLAIPGIMAWIMGSGDLKKMDAGIMDPEGRGMTQAGMIMGIVMSIFVIIGIVISICYFLIVIVVLAGAAGAAGAAGGM